MITAVRASALRKRTSAAGLAPRTVVNLLPGPVKLHPSVQDAFRQPPVSHRGRKFVGELQTLRERLCQLVNASFVDVLLGSGTLSNDAVAAQLRSLGTSGLVLINGEFGERLRDHAERWQLPFDTVDAGWGSLLPYDEIDTRLARDPAIDWIWCVHCETSMGVLNELERLKQIARDRDTKLVVDCISSIGNVPVDVEGLYLANAVSGKALASYAGLCMVFRNHQVSPNPRVPRYLDLGAYDAANGVAYTQSSNLIHALAAALRRFEKAGPGGESVIDGTARFRTTRSLAAWLRPEIAAMGFEIVAPEHAASPAVLSIRLPDHLSSIEIGDQLADRGFLTSYNSGYLVARNLLQICLMGELERCEIEPAVDALAIVASA